MSLIFSSKKRYFILLFFICAIFAYIFVPFAWAQEDAGQDIATEEKTGEETTTKQDSLTNTLKNKADEISEAIPDSVKEKTNNIFQAIEKFRAVSTEALKKNILETKDQIAAVNETLKNESDSELHDESNDENDSITDDEETSKELSPKKPFLYLKLLVLEIIHFIFSVQPIFYILGAIIIISILRSITRRIRVGSNEYE